MKLPFLKNTDNEIKEVSIGFYKEEMILIGIMNGFIEIEATRYPADIEYSDLGSLVFDALKKYNLKTNVNKNKLKKSDWPSYQASGVQSMKTFENGLIDINIKATKQELILHATFRNNQEIAATTNLPISSSPLQLGKSIKHVRNGVIAMRNANVV